MWIRSPRVIGRRRELDELTRALHDVRGQRGGAVFLVGESGIGKSRLVTEIAGQATPHGVRVLRGRGSRIGPMVPFRPIAEALVAQARHTDPDCLAELGPYLPVLGLLVPDWRQPDTTELHPSLLVVAEAVLRLLALLGRGDGCVFVLDDLQDADPETLFIVEYLLDNLTTAATLLVGAIRNGPSEAYELAQSAARRQCGVILRLDWLDCANVHQLAAACLDTEPTEVQSAVTEMLWRNSAGSPLIVEELLHEWVSDGLLIKDHGGWRLVGELPAGVPVALATSVAARADQLGPQGKALLSAAAIVGHRFPLSVVQKATGVDDRELLSHLHAGVAAQLISPDGSVPDWYVFRHPLTSEALLETIPPARRAQLAIRVADAVETLHPGLPGDWCPLVATLRLAGADPVGAGLLFAEAGKRALTNAAVDSAVALLKKADDLLTGHPDTQIRCDVLEALVHALGESGQYQQAFALVPRFAGIGTPARMTALHTKLAWVAYLGGRPQEGLDQVAIARAVHRPDLASEQLAALDAVHANLLLELPGADHLDTAERLARDALKFAERNAAPATACQALQVLGLVARDRDLVEAADYLRRAKKITEEHRLPLQRTHVLIRLGGHQQLADDDSSGLELARQEAIRTGAIPVACTVDVISALNTALHGDFDAASKLIERNLPVVSRFQLRDLVRYSHATRAVVEGHQGNRQEMENAIAELHDCAGTDSHEESLTMGLARTFCALLEEDVGRARRELAAVAAFEREHPTGLRLTGQHGLEVLLDVLAGKKSSRDISCLAAASQMRWNRQFVYWAEAVLHGRAGRHELANAAAQRAVQAAQPYQMTRRLAARLVTESAAADGWGDPVNWLRDAEEYFHQAAVPAVASACRTLLRKSGEAVRPRRTGLDLIPRRLRDCGITVREYEVLQLLAGRLGNKEIATRLHISPKTVEKHVASLLRKTCRHSRTSLTEYASMFQH